MMLEKIARNTFYLFSAQIFNKTIGFLWTVYLARRLGREVFGQYQIVLAYVFTFFALVDFGLNRLLIRDLSQGREEIESCLGNAFGFRLLLAFFSYLFALVFALFFGYPFFLICLFALTSLIFFLQGIWFCLSAIFIVQEKMEISAFGDCLQALLTPFFGLLFLKLDFGLKGVLGGLVVSAFFVLLYFLLQMKKSKISFRFSFEREKFFYFFQEGGKFAFLTILSLVYLKNGILILGRLKGPEIAGLYSAGFKVVEVGIILPNALATAFFPKIASLALSKRSLLVGVYRRSLLIALGLALFLVVGTSFFAREILVLLFGPEFLPAVPVFSLLSFSLLFFFPNALAGDVIQSSEKLSSFLPWALCNTCLNFFLNFLLTLRFSVLGPAYAIIITEAIGFVINNLFVLRILQ